MASILMPAHTHRECAYSATYTILHVHPLPFRFGPYGRVGREMVLGAEVTGSNRVKRMNKEKKPRWIFRILLTKNQSTLGMHWSDKFGWAGVCGRWPLETPRGQKNHLVLAS